MAGLAKLNASNGVLVKKAERAGARRLEPAWAKLIPLFSDEIYNMRADDARSFGRCVFGLRMWSNGSGLDICIVLEKEERAFVMHAISVLEKAHGREAKMIAHEFWERAGVVFLKGDPMPSKPSKLIGEIEGFCAVRKWLGETKAKDIEAMRWPDLNLLRSDLCDECFGRSSPLVKKMVAEEAQALLERIDKARIESASH